MKAVGAVIFNSLENHGERDKNLENFVSIASKQELTSTIVHRCGSDELL